MADQGEYAGVDVLPHWRKERVESSRAPREKVLAVPFRPNWEWLNWAVVHGYVAER